MGKLIQSFNFGRNSLKKTLPESIDAARKALARVEAGVNLGALKDADNGEYNVIQELISYVGMFAPDGKGSCRPTELAKAYQRLAQQEGEDAWRWLITRALWRYVVPNGTRHGVNTAAKALGISFSFFRTMIGLLIHLSVQPGPGRFLYYEEVCRLLDDDAAWALDADGLYAELQKLRAAGGGNALSTRKFLEDLEPAFGIGRDNFNTLFNKAFRQTGLFEYAPSGGSAVGIAMSPRLDDVLQRRIRFVLDHAVSWDLSDWHTYLELKQEDLPPQLTSAVTEIIEDDLPEEPINEIVPRATADFGLASFRMDEELVRRFCASLLSKRFVILTGLSGSGKTKLAQAFARWLTPYAPASKEDADGLGSRYYAVVPVGADWTSKESSLGYPDALTEGKYVRATRILDLILRAESDTAHPYFVILDEMNLSHVERYFAELLSAIESDEALVLHHAAPGKSRILDGVPASIGLPPNLFIVGTVNVDESTYMFSPKVLDRANTIEFRVGQNEMAEFLSHPAAINLGRLDGAGRQFGRAFVTEARRSNTPPPEASRMAAEVQLVFAVMAKYGVEFGFRTVKETGRFLYFHKRLHGDGVWDFRRAWDEQVCQRLLPKLNGSRRRLEPILCALSILCYRPHNWDATTGKLVNSKELLEEALKAGSLDHEELHPLQNEEGFAGKPEYSLSFDKTRRMLGRLTAEGFASFAEA